ncbi:MAG: hypothetical protein QM606_02295 [Leucobacter sp.]
MSQHAKRSAGAISAGAIALLTSLLLTGCVSAGASGPGEQSSPADPVEPGSCFDSTTVDENNISTPDLASRVPCTEPHVFELAALLDLPRAMIDPSASLEEIRAQRAEVVRADGTYYAEWAGPGLSKCMGAVNETVDPGWEIDGMPESEAQLRLRGDFSTLIFVMPADDIAATGSAEYACVVQYADQDSMDGDDWTRSLIPVRSGSDHPAYLDYRSDAFPIEIRECRDRENRRAPCGGQHFTEVLAQFNAAAVLGEEQVSTIVERRKSQTSTTEEYARGSEVCDTALREALGIGSDRLAIEFVVGHDWESVEIAEVTGICVVHPSDSANFDIQGSVVGLGDEEPQLIALAG